MVHYKFLEHLKEIKKLEATFYAVVLNSIRIWNFIENIWKFSKKISSEYCFLAIFSDFLFMVIFSTADENKSTFLQILFAFRGWGSSAYSPQATPLNNSEWRVYQKIKGLSELNLHGKSIRGITNNWPIFWKDYSFYLFHFASFTPLKYTLVFESNVEFS